MLHSTRMVPCHLTLSHHKAIMRAAMEMDVTGDFRFLPVKALPAEAGKRGLTTNLHLSHTNPADLRNGTSQILIFIPDRIIFN